MICDNKYCIFNDRNECIYDIVSIDDSGSCSECMLVSIDDAELEKLKINQLNRFAAYDCDNFENKMQK